jgi:hypothetical protein
LFNKYLSPFPLSLAKGRGSDIKRGGEAPSLTLFPLSVDGEGDKRGEVN